VSAEPVGVAPGGSHHGLGHPAPRAALIISAIRGGVSLAGSPSTISASKISPSSAS
jgi:hypothetical protein